jgi:hypothetical protein
MAVKPWVLPTLAAKMAARVYLLLPHPLLNGCVEPELDGTVRGSHVRLVTEKQWFMRKLTKKVHAASPETMWHVIRVLNYSGDRLVWRNIDGRSIWQDGGIRVRLRFRRIKRSWSGNDDDFS